MFGPKETRFRGALFHNQSASARLRHMVEDAIQCVGNGLQCTHLSEMRQDTCSLIPPAVANFLARSGKGSADGFAAIVARPWNTPPT